MSARHERAWLLFQQSRFELAERELRQVLTLDPDDPIAHALLALCLSERKQPEGAVREAEQAVRLTPDWPYVHYVLASVWYKQDQLDKSRRAIQEAIRLDLREADYFALLTSIHCDREQWAAALTAAEQGLAIEPEHIGCANLRGTALMNLGRLQEAQEAIASALTRDPENSFSHASLGWVLLHQADDGKALHHFREALRLDPGSKGARDGLFTALRARNPLYRMVLAYHLWMSRPPQRAVLTCGLCLAAFLLQRASKENPEVAPLLWAIMIADGISVGLVWITAPVDWLLRLDEVGLHIHPRDVLTASNCAGAWLLMSVVAFAACMVTNVGEFLLAGAIGTLMAVPTVVTFHCPAGPLRRWMAGYTAVFAAAGLTGGSLLVLSKTLFAQASGGSIRWLGAAAVGFSVLGAILSVWLAKKLGAHR